MDDIIKAEGGYFLCVIVMNQAIHISDKATTLQNLFNEIYIQDITKRNCVKNIGELEGKKATSVLQTDGV